MNKLIPAAVAALLLAGCGTQRPVAPTSVQAQRPVVRSTDGKYMPIIHWITANGAIGHSFSAPPNQRIRFECMATGQGALTFDWRAWGPIFGMGPRAEWVAPFLPGTYQVEVTARDFQGYSARDWVWIQVRPMAKFEAIELDEKAKAGAKTADQYKQDAEVLPSVEGLLN